jgi:hypothetical protein
MTRKIGKRTARRKPGAQKKTARWLAKGRRWWARHGRDAPLIAYQTAATLCIEGIGALYAIDHAPPEALIATPFGRLPLEGLLGALAIICFASLGSYLLYVAGAKAGDRRAHVRCQTARTFLCGLALLAPCMDQFANGIAWPRQKLEYAAYHGSAAEAADLFTLSKAGQATSNPEKDAEARAAIRQGVKPAVAQPSTLERLGAIFMYASLGLAAFFGRAPAPMTPAEERALDRAEARAYRDRKETEKRKRAEDLARRLRRQGWPDLVPDFIVELLTPAPKWEPPEVWRGAAAVH